MWCWQELVVLEHLDVMHMNGFEIEVNEQAPPRQRPSCRRRSHGLRGHRSLCLLLRACLLSVPLGPSSGHAHPAQREGRKSS